MQGIVANIMRESGPPIKENEHGQGPSQPRSEAESQIAEREKEPGTGGCDTIRRVEIPRGSLDSRGVPNRNGRLRSDPRFEPNAVESNRGIRVYRAGPRIANR